MMEITMNVGPNGGQLFNSVAGESMMGVWGFLPRATPKAPISGRVLEITGIADGTDPSNKVVDFSWIWDFRSAPTEIQTLFQDSLAIKSKAHMRHYDDGWRVESIQ